MAVVHLCRHGQDEDNREGILNGHRNTPLTELGRDQAATLASKLKAKGVTYDAILSSPLQRAHETANTVGKALDLPVRTEEDLIERDFGVFSGKPISSIATLGGENVLQGDKVLYFLSAENAESFDECLERARSLMKRVNEEFSGKRVLLVCHGDIGKMIVAVQRGITWREALLLPYFANTEYKKEIKEESRSHVGFLVTDMSPKRWKRPVALDSKEARRAELLRYIKSYIEGNNLLGIVEEELDNMALVLVECGTRREVYDWCQTLMVGEPFAAEVIKRRTDNDLPFSDELPPPTSAARAATGGRQLRITSDKKASGTGNRSKKRGQQTHAAAGGSAALKPGRFECGCFATQHNLRGSCANCGRIICEQEADDSCYACGLDPATCVAYEVQIQNGLVDAAALEQDRQTYETAVARRDQLLQYAETRAKRTKVIDDQTSVFLSPKSAWMSPAEREKADKDEALAERRRKVAAMHRRTGAYTVHLDIMQQNISLSPQNPLPPPPQDMSEDTEREPLNTVDGKDNNNDVSEEEEEEEINGNWGMEEDEANNMGRALPLPSLLQKIWYSLDGTTDAEKKTKHEEGEEKRKRMTSAEVSRRVQQDYYMEDALYYLEQAREKQRYEDEICKTDDGLAAIHHDNDDEEEEGKETVEEKTDCLTAVKPEESTSTSGLFVPTTVMRMKDDGVCLSMHQPWASLLVAGIKTHEGRSWSTNYRGRLWIHAAAAEAEDIEEVERRYAPFVKGGKVMPKHYPTRVLLGYVYLVECMDRSTYEETFSTEQRQESSPYSFICAEAKALLFPLPMDGNHKLYQLERRVHVSARKQLMEL